MSDYTAREVQSAIESQDWGYEVMEYKGESITLRGVSVEIVPVDNYGGVDCGSDIWMVAQVGTQLFKKSGYYASHYGTDWDGPFTEVKPVERTVTVYEAV